MNLSEIMQNPTAILDEAFKHPAMRIRTSRKAADGIYRPDMDVALKAVLNTIEDKIVTSVAEDAKSKIKEDYDLYSEMMQEVQTPALNDDWQSWWDTLVEKAIEPYFPHLSQDWLGNNLIDVPEDVQQFALKLGREYYKTLTYGKTPAQIMSSAGILKKGVELRLNTHNNPTEKETNDMATETQDEFGAVVHKIAAHVGKDFDAMAVYDDVDLASDDDDLLANGAAPRLGLDEADVETLRIARLEHGDDLMDVVNKALETALSGKKVKKGLFGRELKGGAPPLAVTGTKPPAAPKPPKEPKPAKLADDKEGDLNPSVLLALKECGAADADMAKSLGVSRATHNNYVNGKTALSPTAEQYNFIRGKLVDKVNALHEALAELDGTEAHVVF